MLKNAAVRPNRRDVETLFYIFPVEDLIRPPCYDNRASNYSVTNNGHIGWFDGVLPEGRDLLIITLS